MPHITIKTGMVLPDGKEEVLSEYLCDYGGCANVAEHVMGCVRELGTVYVVCREHAATLESLLKQKLPEYMIPSAFVFLDAVPLTPNGKLDRNALPFPDRTRPEFEKTFVAPRTPTERLLAEIWADVLNVKKVGIYDNFFDLGGHSLMAVRVLSETERIFNQRLPIAMLFQFPTVEQLAGVLIEKSFPRRSSLIPIQPIGSKWPFFIVHGDYAYSRLVPYLDPDQPVYGLAQHLEGRKVRHTRIKDIAGYHLNNIRKIQPEGPYFIAGHSVGALVAFEMAQQLHTEGQEIAIVALLDPPVPGGLADRRSVHSRVRQHALNLSSIGPRDKLNYGLKWLKSQIRTRIYDAYCKRLVCEIYHLCNKPLPPKLEKFYIDSVFFKTYRKAASNYSVDPYPGRVIYFKAGAETRGSVAPWKRLAQGGLEVHEVSGDHLSMLVEPHVQELAKKLSGCLSEARAAKYVIRDRCEIKHDAHQQCRDGFQERLTQLSNH